jgi:N-acetyl-anhydromuramyl-L-alanine amidase AmpD
MIWRLVQDAFARLRTPQPGTIIDRRSAASREKIGGIREWQNITGICLHQTAVVLGERPARWDTLGAHIGITRAGKVIWLHDFTRVVWHGNGFNTRTVGIEIDGLYAGIEGDASTVWGGKTPNALTAESIEAARQTIRWICSEVERNGGKVNALVAHRQSSAQRRSDPGSAIWQQVALPVMAELELGDGGVGFKIGDGRAIPEAWDERAKGVPY